MSQRPASQSSPLSTKALSSQTSSIHSASVTARVHPNTFMRRVSLYSTTALAVLFFFCGAALAQPASPLFDVLSTAPALSSAQRSAEQQLVNRETSRAVQLIRFNNLDEMPKRTSASVILAVGKAPVVLRATRFQARADGFMWAAHNEEDGSSAFLSVTDGSVYGTIHASGKTYSIEPLGAGLHALVEIATEAFGPDEPADFEKRIEEAASLGSTPLENSGNSRSTAPSIFSMTGRSSSSVIDVLVVYTAAAAATTSNINGLIQGAVASANVANGNSLVAEQINLVGMVQVSYTEPGNHTTTINDLVGTNDGKMDNVHSLRNTYVADIVVLMVANLGMVNNEPVYGVAGGIGAVSTNAFATVRTDAAIPNYTFAHEIGHLMGARHDNDPGASPYGNTHGYRYAPAYWRTIMAVQYEEDPVGRIQYWSNPYVSLGGVPMGTVSYYYAANAWASRGAIVAGFRTPPPPPDPLSVTLSGPVTLGFKESFTFTATVTGGSGSTYYTWYRQDGGGGFFYVGCSSSTCTQTMLTTSFDMRVDVSRGGETASATAHVTNDDFIYAEPEIAESELDYTLALPYPNPVVYSSNITFTLPEAAYVHLAVYDLLGRQVALMEDAYVTEGNHVRRFVRDGLSAGVYLYRIEVTGGEQGSFTSSGSLTLL